MWQNWVVLCDRCGTLLLDEREGSYGSAVRRRRFIVERARKGRTLHYCSEACCVAHRGPLAGHNRLSIAQALHTYEKGALTC